MITIDEIAIIVIDTPKKKPWCTLVFLLLFDERRRIVSTFRSKNQLEGEGAERLPPVIKGCNGPINRILRPRVN